MTADQLTVLHKAQNDLQLTSEERARFNNYFIGSLACHVPPEIWNRAIQKATTCVRQHARQEGTAA